MGDVGTRPEPAGAAAIGSDRPRPDSVEKVTGAIRFAADEVVPGLLHARPVLSVYAHARIEGIDRSAALAVPGVVAVLTAADLPIRGDGDMRMFHPLADREAVFAGQPVALVVATSEEAAADGAAALLVDATPLPAVTDVEAAMQPGSPLARARTAGGESDGVVGLHSSVGGGAETATDEPPMSANVIGRHVHTRGDAAASMARSDATVRLRIETPWVYQAYLEPHAATAIPSPDGGLEVRASAQGTQYARSQLAEIFGLPVAKVTVHGTPLGGGFGSKLLVADPLAAGAALALKRPVRVAFTRREDFAATNPAPGAVTELEVGARADGTFTALRARLYFETGAWSEWNIASIAAVMIAGPYRWEAFDLRGYGVETNRVGTGSYRAPGGPQVSFAIESAIDQLARVLDLDPLVIRRRNLAPEGEPMPDGTPWPRVGTPEVLDVLAAHPMWTMREALPPGEGVGLGVGVWAGACAPASLSARLEGDGTLTITTGVVDMSGTTATLQALAAEAFGLRPDDVTIVVVDARAAATSPTTGGSVVTYSVGRSVVKAATEARDRFLAFAAERMEIAAGDLEIVGGVVRPRGAPDLARTVADLAGEAQGLGVNGLPIEGHGSTDKPALAPGVTGHLAHVRVDPETGQVELLRYLIVQDVGRAISPPLVEGQMRGGAAQGIGWALLEELAYDDEGQLLTGSFMDYAVPRAASLPPIETRMVEVPAPDGPFGARGVGEPPVCGGAGAIGNAIAAAAGVRLTRLPMTAPRVLDALVRSRAAR